MLTVSSEIIPVYSNTHKVSYYEYNEIPSSVDGRNTYAAKAITTKITVFKHQLSNGNIIERRIALSKELEEVVNLYVTATTNTLQEELDNTISKLHAERRKSIYTRIKEKLWNKSTN